MSGATYTRGVTCACTLLLCACYLDGASHLHVCALCMHTHAMTIARKTQGQTRRDKLFDDSECSDFDDF